MPRENTATISIFAVSLDLDSLPWDESAEIAKSLSISDRERYDRMSSHKRRRQFVAGRLLLRYALQQRFGPASRSWHLAAPEGIRPWLDSHSNDIIPPSISIAHSADLIVCAAAPFPAIGIDVEQHRPLRGGLEEMAQATLHQMELSEMALLPESDRLKHFFSCWTLKEALSKAVGKGLALPFCEFGFSGNQLVTSPSGWDQMASKWEFSSLLLDSTATLGLAWATTSGRESVTINLNRIKPELLKTVMRVT